MNGAAFASKRARILHQGRSERITRRALDHLAREAGARPIYAGHKVVGWRMPDGKVVCEKRRYRDHDAAAQELANVRAFAHLQPRKIPVRAYACGRCLGWHVTSRV